MITTTYNNNIEIISSANTLSQLFVAQPQKLSIFNFQPLSEQGTKYIYYNDEITGVEYGIGKI